MDGMDPVLFDKISAQAVKAEGTQPAKIVPFDPRQHRLTTVDGKTTMQAAIPSPRKHSASDIPSLVRLAEKFSSSSASAGVVCWANRSKITLVLNDGGYRDDVVTLKVSLSDQILRLADIQNTSKAFTQRELIRELRINFRNCGLPETLVDLLRKVNFEINVEGGAEVQRTKVSVGRSQMAAFKGLEQLPEWLTFQLPTFASVHNFMALIPVALDPDPESQVFRLVPALGEIEKQVSLAEQSLVAELVSQMPAEVPVYFGSPD